MKKYISPIIYAEEFPDSDIICTSPGDEGYIPGGSGGGTPKEAHSRQPLWDNEDFNPFDE